MVISEKQLSALLIELSQECLPEEIPALVSQYIVFLRKKKRFHRFSRIVSTIESQIFALQKKIPILVQTVSPLSPEVKKSIESSLPLLFPAEQYEVSYIVNPHIIGGAIISSPEIRWDGSVKRKIAHLSHHLGI